MLCLLEECSTHFFFFFLGLGAKISLIIKICIAIQFLVSLVGIVFFMYCDKLIYCEHCVCEQNWESKIKLVFFPNLIVNSRHKVQNELIARLKWLLSVIDLLSEEFSQTSVNGWIFYFFGSRSKWQVKHTYETMNGPHTCIVAPLLNSLTLPIPSHLKVLGKSVGLCKTTKRKDQLYISLLGFVWRIICENFNPNGLILAEIWMKI